MSWIVFEMYLIELIRQSLVHISLSSSFFYGIVN
jgi:hypothetical protein